MSVLSVLLMLAGTLPKGPLFPPQERGVPAHATLFNASTLSRALRKRPLSPAQELLQLEHFNLRDHTAANAAVQSLPRPMHFNVPCHAATNAAVQSK
eukprot:scaffold267516_cov21-Tisochrysis_lutea.AAC.1